MREGTGSVKPDQSPIARHASSEPKKARIARSSRSRIARIVPRGRSVRGRTTSSRTIHAGHSPECRTGQGAAATHRRTESSKVSARKGVISSRLSESENQCPWKFAVANQFLRYQPRMSRTPIAAARALWNPQLVRRQPSPPPMLWTSPHRASSTSPSAIRVRRRAESTSETHSMTSSKGTCMTMGSR